MLPRNEQRRSTTLRSTVLTVAPLLALLVFAVVPADAQVGGSITGLVQNQAGVPQMGALVTLLTSEGREARRVYSDHRGEFRFADVFPGEYDIRVALGQFSTAMRDGLAVVSGRKTYLAVSMSAVFANLQLSYNGGSVIRDMSDRWKWVLRANRSNRNILRLSPVEHDEQQAVLRKLDGTFSDTRAIAQVSAGRGVRPTGLANQSDLGTAFAVATSLFGNHGVTVSGNMGANGTSTSGNSSAFRTTYSKDIGLGTPELALTVRQLQASSTASRGLFGAGGSAEPRLETLSLGLGDAVEISDATRLEYGVLYESVSFLNRLQFISPYAKVVHEISPNREIEASYASGVPPTASSTMGDDASLRYQVDSLGLFPRVALTNGRPTVQRAEHVEVAYRQRFGKNMVEAAIFKDEINNVAISADVPDGMFADGNVVPDLYSRTSTLNGGRFQAPGMRVSYARKLRDHLQAALGYGLTGVLTPNSDQLASATAADLRDVLSSQRAHMVMASISTEFESSGTQLTSSYQWSSRPSVIPGDLYNGFASQSDPGLNLVIRQPLPVGGGLPGKFEASADFRNLLKSGYVPLQAPDGRMVYLLQAIRSYRGAVSFIF